MSREDTIYGLSTGGGVAAIAVVRLSGPLVGRVIGALTGDCLPPARQFAVRAIVDPKTGDRLDEAVVLWLPGPGSFTGEDCAELHLHGSRAVVSDVFAALSGFPGVRLAVAGEFTRRAWANGKLDLVEVEGLGDLLEAQTSRQRRQALHQMSGMASSVFDSWRERLIGIRADIEATVDFADEDGVADAASQRIDEEVRDLIAALEWSVAESRVAEVVRSGVKVVLVGPPNTGKSSLLNALAKREVAIVSPTAGTTRDVIEVTLDMGGIPVILTDTAGLRDVNVDPIEEEGVRRAWSEVAMADVVIWVASRDVAASMTVDEGVRPDVVVLSKADLGTKGWIEAQKGRSKLEVVALSAKTGEGVPDFMRWLSDVVAERYAREEAPVVVTHRQRDAVTDSIRYLNDSLQHGLASVELKAEDIRRAADAIGRVTGRTDVEEWLGAIFSRFCIGK